MDISVETAFVNTFIEKDKRKRLLFELTSEKKRSKAIERIYCATDRKYAVENSEETDEKALTDTVKRYCRSKKDCYIISQSNDDGKTLPIDTAIRHLLEYETTYVFIFDENTAMVASEYDTYGTPSKLFLQKTTVA